MQSVLNRLAGQRQRQWSMQFKSVTRTPVATHLFVRFLMRYASSYLDYWYAIYSWRQKSAYKTDTGSAQSLVRAVNAMSPAVRPDSVSRQACALAGVTAAVEKACAASCKALTEAAT